MQDYKKHRAAVAQAKANRLADEANTRAGEQRRMNAIENGLVNSDRGAQIYMPDPNKQFDPNRATSAAQHGYTTGKAQSKGFFTSSPVRMDAYQARDFNAPANQAAQHGYATNDANTKGRFLFFNFNKNARTKTVETKQSADATKAAPSHALADGRRPYLGPESRKAGQPVDPKSLANWRTQGEAVIYTDGTVEKVSTMKELSVDDVRELLNKSK